MSVDERPTKRMGNNEKKNGTKGKQKYTDYKMLRHKIITHKWKLEDTNKNRSLLVDLG